MKAAKTAPGKVVLTPETYDEARLLDDLHACTDGKERHLVLDLSARPFPVLSIEWEPSKREI